MAQDSAIGGCLAGVPADQRVALQRLREQLGRLLPDAEGAISYGIPTFKLNGRSVIWFAAWKTHCSLYPLTDSFMAEHGEELEGFRRTKGSVHFTPEAPLPERLVAKLVKARLADLEAGRG